jgi:pathogenesis-related protein 1
MNEEIRIGKKKTMGLLIPSLAGVAVGIGCLAVWHWSDVGGCLDRINSRVAQLDQAVRRLDALEKAFDALPSALPGADAVAPLLAPPVVIPPVKVFPAPPQPPKSRRLLPLLSAPAVAADSWQDQMLEAHNDWRRVVDVPLLVWSAELERAAQQVADQLAAGTCELKHSGRRKYGENLHKSGALKWTDGHVEHSPESPAQIVAAWGSEADSYRWADNACSGVCGHYTQVVWKDTKAVGCARARCGNKEDIAACLYDPAGNVRGKRPF